jgi:hypothetical protein
VIIPRKKERKKKGRDDHETSQGVFMKSLVGGGEGWIYALGHPRSNS